MTQKTEMIHARLTENEKKAFKAFATEIGESPSRLMRKFVRETINDELDLLTDEACLLKIAIRQLIGIANNLNQITTAINAGISKQSFDNKYMYALKTHIDDVKETLRDHVLRAKRRWVRTL